MKTFFLFAFPFLFAGNALVAQQITQVINSNIRAGIQFYEFYTSANNDVVTQDDPCIQLDLKMLPSGLALNETCVTWHCDAPCTYAHALPYFFSGLSFQERFDVLMLAYESDNNDEWCVHHNDDDFYFIGNATLANDGWVTDAQQTIWDYSNGYNGTTYIFPSSNHFNAKYKIVWRYEAGETFDDPLQFGSLPQGQFVYYNGTNLPNPDDQDFPIDMGWQDDGGNSSPDVFFSFSLDQPAQTIISTNHSQTDYDTYLELYDSAGNTIDYDDDGGSDGKSVMITELNPGNYVLKVEGYNNNAGQFLLSIVRTVQTSGPANDASCAAIPIPADGSVQSGFTNSNAGVVTGEDVLTPPTNDCVNSWCDGNQIDNSVWFRFAAPATGAVEVSTCGMADFDTQIAAYSVGNCNNYGSYTLVGASDDITGCDAYTSKMNVGGLTPGQSYYILVDGFLGETGNFSIQVTPIMASAAHEAVAGSPLLKAYPNPTSGLLTVRLDDPLTMQACTLSDLTGKTVAELRWTQPVNQTELELGALPAGVYFLQVRSGERVFSEKIMVK